MSLKKILMILLAITSLTSCSQDDSNNEVKISSTTIPVIPASAISCLNEKSGLSAKDVSADYVRVPLITINRKDTSSDLIIYAIKFNFSIPGSATPFKPAVYGDGLAALSSIWYANSKEAKVSKGTATFTTDCHIKIGGINMAAGVAASGTMEIVGFERDANGDEFPVKFSSVLTIETAP